METKKSVVIGVATSLIVVAVAVSVHVFSPKPAETLIDASEFVTRGDDPNPNYHDDVINITIRWKGYDDTSLTIDVIEIPPRGSVYNENPTVDYGDIFVVNMREGQTWAEISADKYAANQIVSLSPNGLIEPIYG